MNSNMTLSELIARLSEIQAGQSPHVATNITEVKIGNDVSFRVIELEGAYPPYSDECPECDDLEDEVEALDGDIRNLRGELASAHAEILKLQQDVIDIGMELTSVLSR